MEFAQCNLVGIPVSINRLVSPRWAATQNGPICLASRKMKPSNSSSGGIQGDVGQARDRNGNEQVRPQSESASQTRYWWRYSLHVSRRDIP